MSHASSQQWFTPTEWPTSWLATLLTVSGPLIWVRSTTARLEFIWAYPRATEFSHGDDFNGRSVRMRHLLSLGSHSFPFLYWPGSAPSTYHVSGTSSVPGNTPSIPLSVISMAMPGSSWRNDCSIL